MAIQLSEQNKAMLAVLAAEVIKQQKPEMQAMVRDMCAQLSSPMAPATGGGSFSPLLTPVFVPNQNQNQNGNSMGGSNGSCGCSFKPGNGNPGPIPPVPALPPQACGIPNMPAVGGGSLPIGTWNCEQVQRDLAACTVAKIMREEKLPTVTGDLAGAIAAGETIAAEFAPIGVSHSLCVDFVRVTISDGGDPPVVITVPIAEIGLQGEIIVQNPDGTYAHAWDFADPERPSYLGITDGRPAASSVAYGAIVVIFNLSADPGSIDAAGADTINTAGSLSIAANTTAIVMKQSETTWIAVLSA